MEYDRFVGVDESCATISGLKRNIIKNNKGGGGKNTLKDIKTLTCKVRITSSKNFSGVFRSIAGKAPCIRVLLPIIL